jgi:branched-chain amino acid transport system ATP-binding protein
LAIARCLCGRPRLVLLDEPTEGIQPSIIEEIVEILQRLREKSGLTMILVEQNLEFIAELSKRILIIQKGAITREVRPEDLGDASLVGEFIGITT